MSKLPHGIDVGKMALDGLGQVVDTMDFVKRAWSTFNLPTPFAPTLSLEELDKRIADLRAVEQWVTLNQNMLRNTIQGLEIQRGTLSAVRNLSESIGQVVKPADAGTAQSLAQLAAIAAQQAAAQVAGARETPPPQTGPGPDASPSSSRASEAASSTGPRSKKTADTDGADAASARPTATSSTPSASPADAGTASAAAGNPLLWWNLLQQQFQQIAQVAAGSQAATGAAVERMRATLAGGPANPAEARQEGSPVRESAARNSSSRKSAARKTATRGAARQRVPAGVKP